MMVWSGRDRRSSQASRRQKSLCQGYVLYVLLFGREHLSVYVRLSSLVSEHIENRIAEFMPNK